MSENDFECFASTGVNTPETKFPNFGCCDADPEIPILKQAKAKYASLQSPSYKEVFSN